VLGFEEHCENELLSLRSEYKDIAKRYPNSSDAKRKTCTTSATLPLLSARHTGESEAWLHVIGRARADKVSLRRLLEGESLLAALHGVYVMTLAEIKSVLQKCAKRKASLTVPKDPDPGLFREQRSRKRLNSSDVERASSAKNPVSPPKAENVTSSPHLAAPTSNFFAPGTAMEVDTAAEDGTGSEANTMHHYCAPRIGPSAQIHDVNSYPLDEIFRLVSTNVQRSMSEITSSVSEEQTAVITKILINFPKHNGC
jgi:hypothetical protein